LGRVELSDGNISDLVAFMGALSDPCLDDEACLAKWIAEDTVDNPDGNMLQAIFAN
jgi:cytochrome c peroxidase